MSQISVVNKLDSVPITYDQLLSVFISSSVVLKALDLPVDWGSPVASDVISSKTQGKLVTATSSVTPFFPQALTWKSFNFGTEGDKLKKRYADEWFRQDHRYFFDQRDDFNKCVKRDIIHKRIIIKYSIIFEGS